MSTKPVVFKRGTTFSFVVRIPSEFEDGFFTNWVTKAQVRKEKNDQDTGLIANLATVWVDSTLSRELALHHHLTDKWPLGNAEVDVLMISPEGQRLRTSTILFNIVREITK
jgi:hypothetical protein